MPTKSEPPLLRTSERGDFKRCSWLWYMTWRQGLRPIREPTWAVVGTAWHRAMEIYYPVGSKRGSVLDATDMFLQSLDDLGRKIGVNIEELEEAEIRKKEDKGTKVKLVPARELGPIMLKEYHNFYGGDRDWQVVHSEQTFQIDVPDPDYEDETIVVYAGTWDLLVWVKSERRYWLVDHKTARSIPGWGYLDLNDQAGSYLWVAREVLLHKGIFTKGDIIAGIIFSYAKKSPPDGRPVNKHGEALNKPNKEHYFAALTQKFPNRSTEILKMKLEELVELALTTRTIVEGEVSKIQPAKRFERYESLRTEAQNLRQTKRVQDEAIAIEMARNGQLPILKTTTPDCERCVLFDLCTLHEAGEDWEFYRDEMFKRRDPYADHREEMARNGIEL
jgi:Zierdtviridae exonuclease